MGTLVCFHAHPDDECIATGGTMVRAAADGHRVVLVAQDGLEPSRRFVDVGRPERAVLVVLGRAHHPGVDVAEELHALHTEDLRRRFRLAHSAMPELFSVVEKAFGHLAVLASRRHHQHDPVAVGRRLGHGAACRDALVVGVGVEAHERRHRRAG